MIFVHFSEPLFLHLKSFEVDDATVASSLFDGGRLSYPERRRMEYELGFSEPYTLEHECRVLKGMTSRWNSAVRFLSRLATKKASNTDLTLDLLWTSHDQFSHLTADAGDQSLDRLIASLVTVKDALNISYQANHPSGTLVRACEIVVRGLHAEGFPCTSESLEEICDGAVPACVGLGLVDIDWKERT